MPIVATIFLTFMLSGGSAYAQDLSATPQPAPCDVSVSNRADGSYGNNGLSVSLGWPDGTVVFKPGGPGFVLPDGSLSMKFGWVRATRGALTIDGRRTDAAAPPLRANIPCCYGEIGFQATALIFPTPGCWEVTGHAGDARLTFVTRVVQIGAGPGSPR